MRCLLAVVSLLLGPLGCDRGDVLIIRVKPLPDSSETLRATASLGERLLAPRTLGGLRDHLRERDVTFGLRLPIGASGMLHVGVEIRDAENCPIAIGSATRALEGPAALTEIQIDLMQSTGCQELKIDRIEPRRIPAADGMRQVTVHGAGFDQNAVVTIGTVEKRPTWRSGTEIIVDIPPLAAGASCSADLTVRNPSGSSAQKPFLYFRSQLAFSVSVAQTGKAPLGMAVGKLDTGATLDLVTADRDTGAISVLLNNGGFMLQGSSWPVGMDMPLPTAVAIGDFDGDRLADVATIIGNRNFVRLLMNRGGGKLPQVDASLETDALPVSIALADLNRDGRLDLATANLTAHSVTVFLNNGGLMFTRTSIPLPNQPSPIHLSADDLNGDGLPDLVTANQSGSITVFLNSTKKDAMVFTASSQTHKIDESGRKLSAVAIGNLNEDAFPDLAVTDRDGSAVIVLLNQEVGTLFRKATTLMVGSAPAGVAIGDLNCDTLPDLAVANEPLTMADERNISVSINLGQDGFAPPQHFAAAPQLKALVLEDLDQDGRPDLAATSRSMNAVFLLRNLSR